MQPSESPLRWTFHEISKKCISGWASTIIDHYVPAENTAIQPTSEQTVRRTLQNISFPYFLLSLH